MFPTQDLDLEGDELHEECASSASTPGQDIARLTYFAIYALQHRRTRGSRYRHQ
ncbi:MAG: hypothetical protein R2856_17610 [Caldilineaceae bacterium]